MAGRPETDLGMTFTWGVGGESRAGERVRMAETKKERIATEIREDRNSHWN